MFTRLFSVELLKMKRSNYWLLVIIGPVIGVSLGLWNFFQNIDVFIVSKDDNGWLEAWTQVELFYSSLIYPILVGVFAALVCRSEHTGRGWKMLLALPVTRSKVYMSKLVLIILLVAWTQMCLLIFYLCLGWILSIPGTIPWRLLLGFIAKGWLATLPLAAIQLILSIKWSSFSIPIAINIILTLPVLLAVNSSYGQFYPWAQPALAMSPPDETPIQSLSVFYTVILITFSISIISGLIKFNKSDMT
ncbi:ABC transporter permease [Lysinibacillus sp. NPDC094403]|uniref:ABC transporter permease n=1 Tax=Lysinibacillus sp. NPDC094403 TaxID=3390581 RepID=UPI003D035047